MGIQMSHLNPFLQLTDLNFLPMKALLTIGLLVLSNTFMTLAWYGHLKFAEWKWFSKLGLLSIILISWGIALFEYLFQVPANKLGYAGNGGPFFPSPTQGDSRGDHPTCIYGIHAGCLQNRNTQNQSLDRRSISGTCRLLFL